MLPEPHCDWVLLLLSPHPPAVISYFTPALQGVWARDSLLCLYSATQSKALFMTRTRGERRAVLQTTAKLHCGKSSCVYQHSLLQKAEKPQQTFLPTLVCLQLLLTNQSLLDLETVTPRGTPVSHTLKPA